MTRFVTLLVAMLFAAPAVAADKDAFHLGDVDDISFYILINKDNAPRANKNGVVLANVVAINGETRNGHIAGGANRAFYAIDCADQVFKIATVWVKRSTDSEIVWRKNEDVARALDTTEYDLVKPDTVAASVADFACEYVKQSPKTSVPVPSTPPAHDRMGKSIEYIPL
jgi:hypothetical protein